VKLHSTRALQIHTKNLVFLIFLLGETGVALSTVIRYPFDKQKLQYHWLSGALVLKLLVCKPQMSTVYDFTERSIIDNKEFCALHVQSNTTIFYLLVQ